MADTNASPPSPLERVAEWVAADPDLATDAHGRLVMAGDPPLTVDASSDEDRLTLTCLAGAVPAGTVMPGRGSAVRAGVDDADGSVSLSTSVFLDGLTRQSFSAALGALVAAVDALGAAATATPAPKPTTAAPAAVDEPEPTREMPAVWTATHAVPAGGTRAWPDPDPSHDPIATLEARVRLSIAERRGDWARVIGSNGWTGWVDARVLESLAAEPNPGSTPTSGFGLRPLPTIGAAAVALSSLLPWVEPAPSFSANGFDVSARFLFDYTAAGAPDLGWVLVGLAAAALALAAARVGMLSVLVGLATLAVAGLFEVQLYRGITDAGGTFSDFMDIVKLAPALTVAGGVLVIVGARK